MIGRIFSQHVTQNRNREDTEIAPKPRLETHVLGIEQISVEFRDHRLKQFLLGHRDQPAESACLCEQPLADRIADEDAIGANRIIIAAAGPTRRMNACNSRLTGMNYCKRRWMC